MVSICLKRLDKDLKDKEHCVSPQKYHINLKTQEDGRYKNPFFGTSKKFPIESSIIIF